MSRPSKAARLQAIHDTALRSFDEIQTAIAGERLQCLQDRRFYSIDGAQWEGALSEQFANKPRFEVNKIHLSVMRIISEYRNNRITVDFVPKDGTKNDQLADTCDMLYRADEQDSCAEEAYDNAFEEAIGGGFGAWRLRAELEDEEDEENEQQRIRIEPIFDADSSVFFDLNAKRQDKSDAKECFVITGMSKDAFEEAYPTPDGLNRYPSSMNKSITQSQFDWVTPDVVYVAEYYRVDKKPTTFITFAGIMGDEEEVSEDDLDDEKQSALDATGFKESSRKTIKKRVVRKYILSGDRTIEDCGIIAGNQIPVVPVYGKRWFIDGVERCMGHVRLAKDAQRIKNMQLSKLGELSSLSFLEKPILTPEQIAGHQIMWEDDNIKNWPYLLVNPITDASGQQLNQGPLAYTKAPSVPPAMAALLQITDLDMQTLLGNQGAGEEVRANLSGHAVELVQGKIDMQSYIYISNMSKAIKRSGEIWLGMAKDVFVEEKRKVKGIYSYGETSSIELMRPVLSKDGDVELENDLSRAKFDVAVTVGPISASRRSATVKALTGMMAINQDPETQQVLSAMAMMNMDGEGVTDARDYFRGKLVKLGAMKPTEEEAQQLALEAQQQGQDPQVAYLQAAAAQAQAEGEKAQAGAMLAAAKVEETKAKTIATLAGISRDDQKQVLNTVKTASDAMFQKHENVRKNVEMVHNSRQNQQLLDGSGAGAILPTPTIDGHERKQMEEEKNKPYGNEPGYSLGRGA